jgi:hypothetical protein
LSLARPDYNLQDQGNKVERERERERERDVCFTLQLLLLLAFTSSIKNRK